MREVTMIAEIDLVHAVAAGAGDPRKLVRDVGRPHDVLEHGVRQDDIDAPARDALEPFGGGPHLHEDLGRIALCP